VDSAVLLINNISKSFFEGINEGHFFEILKKGFGQKRKMLKGNLSLTEDFLLKCQIQAKARAEDLTLEQWKTLSQKLQNEK
jgi:16S rRNA A1518/A1519 N6-dimethyltransferase RsmA/KsgA/DIM1 with predicted DNA glycosylase/AP lyase activity